MPRTRHLLPTLALLLLAACAQNAGQAIPNDKDHTLGPKAAAVTFLEYGDYQCPACGYVNPMVEQLMQRYQDRVLFAFRSFPLEQLHKNALAASEAAECASAQGKFWEMHRKLYETQKEWSDLADPTETFVGYATALGLNAEQFRKDLTSHSYRAVVKASASQAIALGVNATPTFYINGVQVNPTPQGYVAFQALVDKALADAAVSAPAPAPTLAPSTAPASPAPSSAPSSAPSQVAPPSAQPKV